MTRLPRTLIAAMIAGLAATGCQTSKPAESMLFVQTAASARFTPLAGEDDTFTLELSGVAEKVTYFSDRPYRTTGTMPTHTFIERWNRGKESFAADPPNAAISIAGSDSIWVLALTDPVQDGESLRYRIKPLEDSPHFRRTAATEAVPGTAENVVLFIDNLTYWRTDPMNRPDNFGREDGR